MIMNPVVQGGGEGKEIPLNIDNTHGSGGLQAFFFSKNLNGYDSVYIAQGQGDETVNVCVNTTLFIAFDFNNNVLNCSFGLPEYSPASNNLAYILIPDEESISEVSISIHSD